MKILEVSRVVVIFLMCMCWVDLCVNVVNLHIMREHPNYWELQIIVTFRQILQCGS
jgi:hypothetical protein